MLTYVCLAMNIRCELLKGPTVRLWHLTRRSRRTAAWALVLGFVSVLGLVSAAPASPLLRGNIFIHDPSTMIKCKDRYYLFGTGQGILSKSSSDQLFWQAGPRIFTNPPAWTTSAVPGFTGIFWAPDIIYFNGQYRLYYAVSTWASQVSAIGLATNPTLDPTDPAYRWTDRGLVISSYNGSPYNTIDPSITLDASGNPWMSFGSYWNGIYLVQLDPATGLRISPSSPTYRLAWNNAIEASCLTYHGGYYYLFVDWGSCCSGINSTYNVRVGRSAGIAGPYLDRNGVDMVNAGGTLFLEGTGKFTGPGHIGIWSENGSESFTYHYYDAGAWAPNYNAYGVACFDLEPLSWTADGWPVFTNDWSALYQFDADARDDNGQYYGLLQGGARIRGDPIHAQVLNLSGTNQFVRLPPGVAYARTFVAVVKWNGGAPWQRIFDFGTDTSSYIMLTPLSGDGKLRCDIRAASVTQVLAAPGPLPTNTWTQVALTLDGSKGILYVNGSAVATNAAMSLSPLQVRAQTNHLGHSKFSADPDFSGQIACFRVYGRALSPADLVAPQCRLAQPATGMTYKPGDTIAFNGRATDFADVPLASTSLTWTVQFVYGPQTNVVLGPVTGVTNGCFGIPTTGPSASNGFYRIFFTATDAAGRKATNYTDVFPATVTTARWSSLYPFDAGAQDASNHFNGSLVAGASIQTDPTRGHVLNLSGSGQFVGLPPGVAAMQTFSGWVKWNGGAPWQRIFDFGAGAGKWAFLTPLDSSGNMQCAMTSESGNFVQVIEATNGLPTNVWAHVAVVFDGREGILYTNGQAAAVNNSVNLLPSDLGGTRNFFGQSQYAADPFFDGQLDSIKLDSGALSLPEILAPTALILQPSAGTLYSGGDVLQYSGVAADFSDTPLPPSAFSWSAEFHHDNQVDPVFGPMTGATNGSFQVPTVGPTTTNAFYRLNLLVTDSAGHGSFVSTGLLPQISRVELDTVPTGLQLSLDGQTLATPNTLLTVAGLQRELSAPSPQALLSSNYDFVMWSDGGPPTHSISAPPSGGSYIASFVQPRLNVTATAQGLLLGWPFWAASLSLYSATNLSAPVGWSFVTNLSAVSNPLPLPAALGECFYRLQSP